MFERELDEYITHGKEETFLEYKMGIKWVKNSKSKNDKNSNYKIVKTMMAMSNNPSGGVIVVGVKEKDNGEFSPIGVNEVIYDSYVFDDISRFIKGQGLCEPPMQFKVTRDKMMIHDLEKKFVIIQVSESKEMPTICTKSVKCDDKQPFYPENILLRENVIYVRSKSPIESREISSFYEWQELIDRLLEKSKSELLKKMPCFDTFDINKSTKKEKVNAKNDGNFKVKFDAQLRKDNL